MPFLCIRVLRASSCGSSSFPCCSLLVRLLTARADCVCAFFFLFFFVCVYNADRGSRGPALPDSVLASRACPSLPGSLPCMLACCCRLFNSRTRLPPYLSHLLSSLSPGLPPPPRCSFGTLFDGFHPAAWWWKFWEFLRSILLTILLASVSDPVRDPRALDTRSSTASAIMIASV